MALSAHLQGVMSGMFFSYFGTYMETVSSFESNYKINFLVGGLLDICKSYSSINFCNGRICEDALRYRRVKRNADN